MTARNITQQPECHTFNGAAPVHHRIIGEPLKLDRRKLAFQPRVKRVMHEKICQYR